MILFSVLATLLVVLALLFVLPGLVREDAGAQAGPAAARQPRTAWMLALALPIGSVALYAVLGAPAGALTPTSTPAPGTAVAPNASQAPPAMTRTQDRKSTRLNSSH